MRACTLACVGGRHKRGLYRHMRPTRLSRLGGKADIAGGVSKPFRRPCREFSTAWFLVAVGRGRERDGYESLRSRRENRPSGRRRFLTDSSRHMFARAGAPILSAFRLSVQVIREQILETHQVIRISSKFFSKRVSIFLRATSSNSIAHFVGVTFDNLCEIPFFMIHYSVS